MLKGNIIGLTAVLMIVAMLGGDEARAANGWEVNLQGGVMTSQSNASLQLTMGGKRVEGTLDAANANTNPDEAGKVLTEVATITVGSTDGYTVAVSGNVNLTGEKNSNHKIPSVTSAKTLGSMKNEWGYYGVLGDSEVSWNPGTSFKGMSTSQQTVATGGATSSNVTKKVTLFYGARVDNTVAEDFYGNTVTLSVVAQPRTVTTVVSRFSGITTMQQMTNDVCKSANTNDTAQLTDTRDGKKYWVTKMLDGNCWMSQDLKLNLGTSVVASSSGGTFTWNASSSYPPRQTMGKKADGTIDATGALGTYSEMTSNEGITKTYSWNLGDYVLNSPNSSGSCDGGMIGFNTTSCRERGFIDVGSGFTASPDPNFYRLTNYKGTDGQTACTKEQNTVLNTSYGSGHTCAQYDAHYSVGNFYQWNAATAGSGGTMTDTKATGSICPKGWSLPGAGSNALSEKGSWAYLFSAYGMATDSSSGVVTGTASNGYTYNAALSPFFITRSGELYLSTTSASLSLPGGWVYYWSSMPSFGYYATSLQMYSSLSFRMSAERYQGLPVRCVYVTSNAIVSG